ncbi:hypothetical protein I5P86_21875 [Pseudomonas glycinae]|jgi:hypothetical protein|uniref:hypothetical protein n=1 Tax=Pseudomonas TaxID=286 RepID=UPI0018D8EF2C|nr:MULTISPECIES: hypothetical protein [Pseudomonas]MBH3407712.1 hypothetical protein [Pseudomonas glycinae]MDI3397849.1 hypothetical protein [Pseudomonas sp. V88_4]
MDLFTWLALTNYGAAFLITTAFACAYLSRTMYMPYHEIAVGRSWSEVDPPMQLLLLALIKVVGATSLALSVGGYFQLYLLLSREWALVVLFVFQGYCLIAIAPPIVVAMYVRRKSNAHPPIVSGYFALLLTLTGFMFAWLSGRFS